MKRIVILIIIAVLGAGGLYMYKMDTKSVDDVFEHFKQSGLIVTNFYLSPSEQEAVDKAKEAITQLKSGLGLRTNDDFVDDKTKIVNGIQVKISEYKNSKVAANKYSTGINTQKNSRERHQKEGTQYFQTDYYANGKFLMTIYHFNTDSNLRSSVIELNKSDLDKAVAAFRDM